MHAMSVLRTIVWHARVGHDARARQAVGRYTRIDSSGSVAACDVQLNHTCQWQANCMRCIRMQVLPVTSKFVMAIKTRPLHQTTCSLCCLTVGESIVSQLVSLDSGGTHTSAEAALSFACKAMCDLFWPFCWRPPLTQACVRCDACCVLT